MAIVGSLGHTYMSVLMIRCCLYSDIMSDHAQFQLTFAKVGTIYDASINSTHTVMAQIILVSYVLMPRQFVSSNVY